MVNPFTEIKKKRQITIGDDNLKNMIVAQDNYLDIQEKLKALFSADIKTEDSFPINGRDLHSFLGIATDYRKWFPRYIEHGRLVENQDFKSVKIDRVQQEGNRTVTREVEDHKLTLEAAKIIASLQKNELGDLIRRYLIWAEKKLHEIVQAQKTDTIPLTEMTTLAKFRMVLEIEEEHERQIAAIKKEQTDIKQELSDIKAVQTEREQAIESLEAGREEHDIRLTNLEEQNRVPEPVQPVSSRYRTIQGLQYKLCNDDIMSYQESKDLAYNVISENYDIDVELELQKWKDSFTRYYNRQVADRGYRNVPKNVLRPAQIRDLSWIKLISTKQDWFDLVKRTYESLIS